MIIVDNKEQYKKQLAEFSQLINPKPSVEEREKLKEAYLKAQRNQ